MPEIIFENDFIVVYGDMTYNIIGAATDVYDLAVSCEEFVNFMKHNP